MSRSLTSILDRDSRLHDTGLDQALEYHSLDDALTILRFQLQHPQPLFNNTLDSDLNQAFHPSTAPAPFACHEPGRFLQIPV